MPDIRLPKKEDFPEGLREHAVEKDGAFVLDVSPTAKVSEFRDNNIALKKKVEGLEPAVAALKEVVGEDLPGFKSELARLRDIDQQVKDKKLQGTNAINEAVEARITASKQAHEEAIRAAATKQAQTEQTARDWEGKFKRQVLRQTLTAAVVHPESGALVEALEDILGCGEADWRVGDDGTPVRMDGDTKVYGANAEPMSPKEWLADLLKRKPYFAKPSAGGGALGGRGGANGQRKFSQEALGKMNPVDRLAATRPSSRR